MNCSFQTTPLHLVSQTAALYLILLLKETLMSSCTTLLMRMLHCRSRQRWNPFSKHTAMHYVFTVKISAPLAYYSGAELIN